MSDSPAPIRSYQRIFRPDRRIYQIDGKRLPVPGGVPLSWLTWAFVTLLAVLILSARSLAFTAAASVIAALLVGQARGPRDGALAFALVAFAIQLAGLLLGWVDWPLRLLIAPALVATAAAQIAPDGRAAHRYLASRAALRLRPIRASLDRPLGIDGEVEQWAPRVWVAPDHHGPVLHHGRVHGPARLAFAHPVILTPRRGRHVARPAAVHHRREGEVSAEVIELGAGQILEIRP